MKTFKEFLTEADSRKYFKTSEELLKSNGGQPPEGHKVTHRRNLGWFFISNEDDKASKKAASQRREERKNPLRRDEFHSFASRNLIPNPGEFADIAMDLEQNEIKRLEGVRDRRRDQFGRPYHLDHKQPLSQEQRREENRPRFYAIAPAHSARNLSVMPGKDNEKKSDTPPRRGERGSNFTRSGSIRHTANATRRFINDFESLVASVQHSPAERMARAYDRIAGLPPEKPKPREQTSDSSTPRRRVPPPRKVRSRNVPPPRKVRSRNVPPPRKIGSRNVPPPRKVT